MSYSSKNYHMTFTQTSIKQYTLTNKSFNQYGDSLEKEIMHMFWTLCQNKASQAYKQRPYIEKGCVAWSEAYRFVLSYALLYRYIWHLFILNTWETSYWQSWISEQRKIPCNHHIDIHKNISLLSNEAWFIYTWQIHLHWIYIPNWSSNIPNLQENKLKIPMAPPLGTK